MLFYCEEFIDIYIFTEDKIKSLKKLMLSLTFMFIK